jgi:hypothetical protein
VLTRGPCRLCDEQNGGMEWRIQRVVDVGDEGKEARPVDDPSILYRPYRALLGDAVFFPDYFVVLSIQGRLLVFLRIVLGLGGGLSGLFTLSADLVGFEFACLLGGEHARPEAHSAGREGLGQAQLRDCRL